MKFTSSSGYSRPQVHENLLASDAVITLAWIVERAIVLLLNKVESPLFLIRLVALFGKTLCKVHYTVVVNHVKKLRKGLLLC
jgi:hypothetical protein